jgi:DNA polymerase I
MQTSEHAVELSCGGVPEGTAVMTARGPVPVENLDVGDRVYALDVTTDLVKMKPVIDIEPFNYSGPLIHAEARRIDLRLHPEQRFPYRTKSVDMVRFQRAGDIEAQSAYHLISEWQSMPQQRLETVDVTDYVSEFEASVSIDCHGHTFRAALPEGCEPTGRNGATGYHFDSKTFKEYQDTLESLGSEVFIRDSKNHWRRPYRFEGDDFIRFLGWFITEGSITRKSDRDSAAISIAQKTPKYCRRLERLFDRMKLDVDDSGSSYSFGSKVYARLLERLCGDRSESKHLPEFTWDLSTEQQELLLNVLMDGDGNDWDVYYTSSDRLAKGIAQLCVEVGLKPRYGYSDGIWKLYIGQVNDRLHSGRQTSRIDVHDRLYRLTIADYHVVLMGRNGKFQWVGVSKVS